MQLPMCLDVVHFLDLFPDIAIQLDGACHKLFCSQHNFELEALR